MLPQATYGAPQILNVCAPRDSQRCNASPRLLQNWSQRFSAASGHTQSLRKCRLTTHKTEKSEQLYHQSAKFITLTHASKQRRLPKQNINRLSGQNERTQHEHRNWIISRFIPPRPTRWEFHSCGYKSIWTGVCPDASFSTQIENGRVGNGKNCAK